MGGLDSIPVRVEGGVDVGYATDNLRPVLLQVEQALSDLIERGEPTIIDLAAMPFSEQDERQLREQLGLGEVSARLEALGPTLIQETGYSGVWLVEHQDAQQRRLTLHIEIAMIPEILQTPRDDLSDALAALRRAHPTDSDAQTEDAQ